MKLLEFFQKDELFLDWKFIQNKFGDFVDDMKNCQQNSEYHGEGDVFTHTQMVHSKLLKLLTVGYPPCFSISSTHLDENVGPQ